MEGKEKEIEKERDRGDEVDQITVRCVKEGQTE